MTSLTQPGDAGTSLYHFNASIRLAQDYLRNACDRRGVLINRAGWVELATEQVRRALAAANAMHDSERRALCLRLLNCRRRLNPRLHGRRACRSFDLQGRAIRPGVFAGT